jgi:hypothetical protein
LPQSEKDAFTVKNSAAYRGYVRFGEENLDPALAGDVKEGYNVGPDLAADDPDVLARKPFHAINQWPALPDFRPTLLTFQKAALELVVLLHRARAVDLGIGTIRRILAPSTAVGTAPARTPTMATSHCSRKMAPTALKCGSATAPGRSYRR